MTSANNPVPLFKNFLYLYHKHLGIAEPTPRQYQLADYLQFGGPRLALIAFRQLGKTTITIGYCAWLLLDNPQNKIMIVSATKTHTANFSMGLRAILETMPLLHHLRPSAGKGQQSNNAFDVCGIDPTNEPSVSIVGIGGQIVGKRATHIIADDVETEKNSITVEQRDKLERATFEFESVLKLNPGSQIIYLGTPQTVNSTYFGKKNRGFNICMWPALYPENPEKYAGCLHQSIYEVCVNNPEMIGKATDTRFTDEELAVKRNGCSKSYWNLHFMLDPEMSDADRYPLKLRDFITMPVDMDKAPVSLVYGNDIKNCVENVPVVGLNGDRYYRPFYMSSDWKAYDMKGLFIDPSGRGKDMTSYCVLGVNQGYFYIIAWGHIKGGYSDEALENIGNLARDYKVGMVVCEDNFGDGMFTQLLRPFLKRKGTFGVDEVKSKGQKEIRICSTLEKVMGSHRLVCNESIIAKDYENPVEHQCLYQITHITSERGSLSHDDGADVLAIAVGYYQEMLGMDVETSEKDYQDMLEQQEIDRMLADIGQEGKDKGDNWLDKNMADEGEGSGSVQEDLMAEANARPWWARG